MLLQLEETIGKLNELEETIKEIRESL